MIAGLLIVGATMVFSLVMTISNILEIRNVTQAPFGYTTITSVVVVADDQGQDSGEVIISFANSGSTSVLIGLSVHAELRPGWLGPQQSAQWVSRPGRRRYRPTAQSTIGVIPAGGAGSVPVRIPPGRRHCRIVAVAGEANGRLWAMTVRVRLNPPAKDDRMADVLYAGIFPWIY